MELSIRALSGPRRGANTGAMRDELHRPVVQLVATLVMAGVAAAMWAAWLGWDQLRDVHPDGSVSGPYEAWQVIGLVVTLLVPAYWAAAKRWFVAAVLGTTAGLTVAAFADWSADDGSGLFVIGVGMIAFGSMAVGTAVAVVAAVRGRREKSA